MKKFYLLISAVVFVMAATHIVMSQTPPPLPFAPTQAPIDGGLSILAAAGGLYAVKKLRGRKGSP